MNGKKRQKGFALMLVMVLVALALVLGLSYLSTAAGKMISTQNLTKAVHAEYLAESGLHHAIYLFKASATAINGGSTLGPFYIDSSSDYYKIYATNVGLGRYTIYADGYSGSYHVQKNATIKVVTSTQTQMNYGSFMGAGAVTIPAGVKVTGNIMANGGAITNYGKVTGNASATGTIFDASFGISGTKNQNAAKVAAPTINYTQYSGNYSVNGGAYTIVSRNGNVTFSSSDPLNNGGSISGNNPGGIIYFGGDVIIGDNVNFTGTIVAQGKVTLSGQNIQLNAVSGFPAIVAGNAVQLDVSATATVNGLVVGTVLQNKTSDSKNNPVVTINGGFISTGAGFNSGLKGNVTINYNASKASYYDLNGSIGTATLEIVSWN